MVRAFACWLLCLCCALPTFAQDGGQSPIPERRAIVSADTDFPGSDIATYFDTTYAFCREACLGDAACTAFTFNQRSGACFPKSAVDDPQPFVGALSGEIVARTAADLARGRDRAGELSFVSPEEMAGARAEARAVGDRHPVGGLTASDLSEMARSALSRRNLTGALEFAGQALAITDSAPHWTLYARIELALADTDRRDRYTYLRRAVPGAINAYLRAGAAAERLAALDVVADALDLADRGRDMIPVLRLALDLSEDERVAARLDDAIARFGFRIADTQVESDAATPRICADFTEDLVQAGVDYAPFVQVDAPGLAVQARDARLCLDGVEHGQRYEVTFRAGLPAASGETLAKPVTLTLYVRDRAGQVRFPGRGYVLPSGGPVAIPVVGVNVETVDLVLRRISDRSVIRAIQADMFGQPIATYRQAEFAGEISQEVWRGTGELARELNRDVTTRLPIGQAAGGLAPGIYAVQASIPGADPYDSPAATQWFVVSDLGLTTVDGVDGLHVFARSLATAGAAAGVRLTLVSRANAVLGTAVTDAGGVATFAPGLTRGAAGAAPAMVMAETGDAGAPDDMAFLPLTDPEFDLSDRGVEGREPAGPVDVFAATDRGAYRAGDVIVATALVRDDRAGALADVPLTVILSRPDGVEWSRTTSMDGRAGGHVLRLPLTDTAPRGHLGSGVPSGPRGGGAGPRAGPGRGFPARADRRGPVAAGRGAAAAGSPGADGDGAVSVRGPGGRSGGRGRGAGAGRRDAGRASRLPLRAPRRRGRCADAVAGRRDDGCRGRRGPDRRLPRDRDAGRTAGGAGDGARGRRVGAAHRADADPRAGSRHPPDRDRRAGRRRSARRGRGGLPPDRGGGRGPAGALDDQPGRDAVSVVCHRRNLVLGSDHQPHAGRHGRRGAGGGPGAGVGPGRMGDLRDRGGAQRGRAPVSSSVGFAAGWYAAARVGGHPRHVAGLAGPGRLCAGRHGPPAARSAPCRHGAGDGGVEPSDRHEGGRGGGGRNGDRHAGDGRLGRGGLCHGHGAAPRHRGGNGRARARARPGAGLWRGRSRRRRR